MAKGKRRFGDRKEGRKLRSLEPMNLVGNYIMPDRIGASNKFCDSFDVEAAEKYIHAKRAQGLKGFGMLHLLLACYVRTVSQRPGLNRFIGGQKTYLRNKIIVAMTIKKKLVLDAEETVIKVEFKPTDTADEVFNKFNKVVEENKVDGDNSDFDGFARLLKAIPGVLLKFVIWLIKFLDYFDLIPKSLLELSPFHASMYITSMGSLGIPPVYHHLYSLGNVPVFMSYGAKRTVFELDKDGNVQKKKYVDFTMTTDERICDGHYFASAYKYMKELLYAPEQLDVPPETVAEDID